MKGKFTPEIGTYARLASILKELREEKTTATRQHAKRLEELQGTLEAKQREMENEQTKVGELQQIIRRCTENLDLVATRRFFPQERLVVIDTNWIIQIGICFF